MYKLSKEEFALAVSPWFILDSIVDTLYFSYSISIGGDMIGSTYNEIWLLVLEAECKKKLQLLQEALDV